MEIFLSHPKPQYTAQKEVLSKPGPNDITISLRPQNECYKMTHRNRGVALVFHHHYTGNLEQPGTDLDRDAILQTLKELKFNVRLYEDCTKLKILGVLEEVAGMDHSDNDCLVVVVMAHGDLEWARAKDKYFAIFELLDCFNSENCPTLAGKPKLFFVQAYTIKKIESSNKFQWDLNTNDHKMVYTIPVMEDILIMYSTVQEDSMRNTSQGTSFIQALSKRLQILHNKHDLMSILTLVNRDVTTKSNQEEIGGRKEMCSIVNMLTKTLHLNP